MRRVKVPPGCTGLDMADGSRYHARHGYVQVADWHADDIQTSWYGRVGLMGGGDPTQLGTRTSRWCLVCRPTRQWNAWNDSCPRCGAATFNEEQTSNDATCNE